MAAPLSGSDGDLPPLSDINVTPFVDVVLVLLVIFIVTAPQILKDSISIKLPKAANTDSKSATSFGIAINRDGQILLNGLPVSRDELARQARQTVSTHPESQAILSADADTRHGDVVTVIDTLKSAGLERFAVQIEHDPASSGGK